MGKKITSGHFTLLPRVVHAFTKQEAYLCAACNTFV